MLNNTFHGKKTFVTHWSNFYYPDSFAKIEESTEYVKVNIKRGMSRSPIIERSEKQRFGLLS